MFFYARLLKNLSFPFNLILEETAIHTIKLEKRMVHNDEIQNRSN